MDREKKRGKMKIRSWTCRGYRGYQDAVHPELHKMLLSLGGNSIFAELAITDFNPRAPVGRDLPTRA